MRRRPTIISYKPPEGDEGNENNELSDVVVSCDRKTSDHMILDRINAEPSSIEMVQVEDSEDDLAKLNKPLLVYIDGPFGAPTSQIFRAQHAVLIGTGIGVTPFASILQSIMHRYWQARNTCPKCQYQWTSDLSASVGLNLRKVLYMKFIISRKKTSFTSDHFFQVDFFWINRDQRSFEWFVNLLSQLEIEQAEQGGAMERFLDMHMYITSALQKTDMKAVGLQLALDLLHKKVYI